MKIIGNIRNYTLGAVLLGTAAISTPIKAQSPNPKVDTFERTIPPQGTDNDSVLKSAPSPKITIKGEDTNAKIVVDISKNVLYKYDDNGKAEKAFLIASGAPRTPTHKGVRIVTHKEYYPYKKAPANSKRRRTPKAFGPKIICVDIIDPKTGEQSSIGEFIHGNNDYSSLGRYRSHGCMRMDNEVITYLAEEVKRGDIVIIK